MCARYWFVNSLQRYWETWTVIYQGKTPNCASGLQLVVPDGWTDGHSYFYTAIGLCELEELELKKLKVWKLHQKQHCKTTTRQCANAHSSGPHYKWKYLLGQKCIAISVVCYAARLIGGCASSSFSCIGQVSFRVDRLSCAVTGVWVADITDLPFMSS